MVRGSVIRLVAVLVMLAVALPASAERCASERPEAVWGGAFVYDEARDRVLLFGGSPERRRFAGDTWTWTDAGWRCHDVVGPPPRAFAGAAWDPERQHIVLQGGRGEGNVTLADTWAWNGKSWRRLAEEGPRVDHHAVAWSQANRALMAYGGWNGEEVVGDTWLWSDRSWQQLDVEGPPGRSAFAMSADPARRRVVVHGGLWIEGQYADAWAWDGTRWQPLWGPYDGSSVDHHAMVFDRALESLLIFGGKNYRYRPLARTRTLFGATFERLDVEGPSARHSVSFTYDTKRGRALLYGGKIYSGEEQLALDDLWIWQSGAWRLWEVAGR